MTVGHGRTVRGKSSPPVPDPPALRRAWKRSRSSARILSSGNDPTAGDSTWTGMLRDMLVLAAGAAGRGAHVPGVLRAIGRSDVDVVSGSDHPHGHVGPEAAVGPPGGEIQLLGVADAVELVWGPGGGHSPVLASRASG